MHYPFARRLAATALVGLLAGCHGSMRQPADTALVYPAAKTVDVTDNYHGTVVADPYRWLEEYSDDTNQWIDAEEAFARGYLDAIPERGPIKATLERLWNYEKFGVPEVAGGKLFYSRNDGLQNQSVLMVEEPGKSPRPFIDTNTMSADGTVALAGVSPNEEATLAAYAVAEAGSDWNAIRIRDVASGKDLADKLEWVKFSPMAWTKPGQWGDGKGFFYCRFDAPTGDKLKSVNEFHKVYYHKVGDPQSSDALVYERKDQPRWYLSPSVSDDGRWLVMGVESGDSVNNALFYRDLSAKDAPMVELFNAFDAKYSYLGNDGTVFYVWSDLEAPRGRVWAIDVSKPGRSNWKEIVPQTKDTLTSASIVGNRIFCNYLQDAKSLVRVHALDGKVVGDVPLPGICTAGGFGGKRSDKETYFSVSGFTIAPAVWRYELASGKSSVFRAPRVPFDAAKYDTTQVFATSKDGTKVPMFITMRKGTRLDGTNPTLLYGYGGFNIPMTPHFSPVIAAWLELGGIYVEMNLRGGGEYGEEWHKGGMRLTKQNVFDDCIACGEYLISNKYTSTPKLALEGGSNGGLLVGACEVQRPDLWGACLPAVGVMDMLRFQKFTIGWGWVGDYGSSDNADEFKVLYGYSPYHNVKQGVCYPPTLITTGDHDDRVYPAHSFKFAVAMQAAQGKVDGCRNPILLRVEKRAGHGAGKPTSKRIDERADVYAFLVSTFGMKVN